jgi:UDPglucose 6-dehydrogenase
VNISVIGLGKLGCSMAACFSEQHNVIGVDIDKARVEKINNGDSPIQECGVDTLISLNNSAGRLRATTDLSQVRDSQLIFIVVPTPSAYHDRFSAETVQQVMNNLSGILKDTGRDHVVVLRSTVMPGTCRPLDDLLPVNARLVYNPEFFALGNAVSFIRHPAFVLAGVANNYLALTFKKFYNNGVDFPIFEMSYEGAELAKIAYNAFATTRISFINLLADLCEKTKGADVDLIRDMILSDERMKTGRFTAGLGFGGPCFPRDIRAFKQLCLDLDTPVGMLCGVEDINEWVWTRVSLIAKRLPPPYGVFGVTYKSGTSYKEPSQSESIFRDLVSTKYETRQYDPDIKNNEPLETFLNRVNTVVIAKPSPELTQNMLKGKYVIDVWRKYAKEGTGDYYAIGKSIPGVPLPRGA